MVFDRTEPNNYVMLYNTDGKLDLMNLLNKYKDTIKYMCEVMKTYENMNMFGYLVMDKSSGKVLYTDTLANFYGSDAFGIVPGTSTFGRGVNPPYGTPLTGVMPRNAYMPAQSPNAPASDAPRW